jgi:hypothetical protein
VAGTVFTEKCRQRAQPASEYFELTVAIETFEGQALEPEIGN